MESRRKERRNSKRKRIESKGEYRKREVMKEYEAKKGLETNRHESKER